MQKTDTEKLKKVDKKTADEWSLRAGWGTSSQCTLKQLEVNHQEVAEIFQQSETRVDLPEALFEQHISESRPGGCRLFFVVTDYIWYVVVVDIDRNWTFLTFWSKKKLTSIGCFLLSCDGVPVYAVGGKYCWQKREGTSASWSLSRELF